jgi:hypothetical protein
LLDRRRYALYCLAVFMGWSYRSGLRHLHDDPSGWIAFVSLWLPTAIGIGLLIAYGIPAIRRRRRRPRFGG